MKIIRDETRPECGEIHFNDEHTVIKSLGNNGLIIDLSSIRKVDFEKVTQEEHDKMRCKAYKYITP